MSNKMVTPYTDRTQFLDTSKIYVCNKSKLQDIERWVLTATFWNTSIRLLFDTPSQYLIKCMVYPLDLDKLLFGKMGSSHVVLGNTDSDIECGYSVVNLIECGEIAKFTLSKYFNSFLDYEPYTKVQLYLPYYDFVDIDVNMYMGKEVKIGLNVNLQTGEGLYYFEVDGNITETYNCKLGIEIALSQSNANEIARNMLLTGLNVTKQIVGVSADYSYKSGLKSTSKNIGVYETATMGQLGIGSTIDFINTNQKKFLKSSQPSGFLDFTKPQSCYLIISRPNIQRPSNYNHTIGRPSGKTSYLYDLKGFTIVDEIHLDGFNNATQSELNEIETLLKSGVIL